MGEEEEAAEHCITLDLYLSRSRLIASLSL